MKYRNNTYVVPHNSSLKLSALQGIVFMHPVPGKYKSTDGRFEVVRMADYSSGRHSGSWELIDHKTEIVHKFHSASAAKQFARDIVKPVESL